MAAFHLRPAHSRVSVEKPTKSAKEPLGGPVDCVRIVYIQSLGPQAQALSEPGERRTAFRQAGWHKFRYHRSIHGVARARGDYVLGWRLLIAPWRRLIGFKCCRPTRHDAPCRQWMLAAVHITTLSGAHTYEKRQAFGAAGSRFPDADPHRMRRWRWRWRWR
jgi:hypothetical protein